MQLQLELMVFYYFFQYNVQLFIKCRTSTENFVTRVRVGGRQIWNALLAKFIVSKKVWKTISKRKYPRKSFSTINSIFVLGSRRDSAFPLRNWRLKWRTEIKSDRFYFLLFTVPDKKRFKFQENPEIVHLWPPNFSNSVSKKKKNLRLHLFFYGF